MNNNADPVNKQMSSIDALPVIEWNGVRVVTTETLAAGYNTQDTNIRTNLSANKARFIEGVHVFTVKGAQLTILRVSNTDAQISTKTRSITLWTERGAARMSKIVDTDEAWSFFEKMEASYFQKKSVGQDALDTPNFSDPAAAARAWADEYEAKNKAIGYVHRQSQYINHLENLFTDGMTPFEFCKQLNGVNVQQVNAYLEEHNWLYDDTPNHRKATWRVKAYSRDLYLTERYRQVDSDDGPRDTYKPILIRKGAIWLYRHYLKGSLPMKMNWNGVFTHDKELAETL